MIVDNYDCKPLHDVIVNLLNDNKPLGEFEFIVTNEIVSITIPDSEITLIKFINKWIDFTGSIEKIGLGIRNWGIEHETGKCNVTLIIFEFTK